MQRLKNSHLWPVASWQVLTFGNVSEQAVVILAWYGCWRTQSIFLQHGQIEGLSRCLISRKKKDVVSDSLEVLMKHLVGFSVSKAVCRTGHTELQWDHPDFLDGRNEPRSAPWRSAQRGREVSASCFRGAVAQGCAVSEGSPISLSYQICRSLAVSVVQRIQVVVRGGFFMDITEKAGIYFEVG